MSTNTTPTSSPFPLRRRLTGILDDKPESEMAIMRQQILTTTLSSSSSPPTSPAPLRRRLSGILDDKLLATPKELALVKQLHDSQKSLMSTNSSSVPPTSPMSANNSPSISLRRRLTGVFDEPGARELAMMEQLRFDSTHA